MSSQEIVTLQLGNYSNHVGTHFWNLQYHSLQSEKCSDEYGGDSKLFREKPGNHQLYVPRMISFDFKTNLHALKLDGTFQSAENGRIQLPVDTDDYVTYAADEIKRKNFPSDYNSKSQSAQSDCNVEEDMNTWSDFMNYTLDENSLQLLKNRFEDESKFVFHGLGYSDYAHIKHDIDDKLHYWVEECNSLEGFMMFTDMHDAFSGVASNLLHELHDEYRSKTVLPFINWPPTNVLSELNVVHCLNAGLMFQSFAEHSSMFVLQSLKNQLFTKRSEDIVIPNVSYKSKRPYHSSAILASAIDSIASPWKWSDGCCMLDICQHMTQGLWKLSGSAIGFPLTASHDISLFERMPGREFYGDFLTSLFPHVNKSPPRLMSQSIVFQDRCGVDFPTFGKRKLVSLGLSTDIVPNNPKSFLEFVINKQYPPNLTSSKLFYQKPKVDLRHPFPFPVQYSSENAIMSSLFTSATFYDMLSQLILNIQKIKLNKLHLLQEYGLDEDTHKTLIEDLHHLAEQYNTPLIGN